MPGGLAGTSQGAQEGAPRPAFRPSPGAGTPPRRNCVPGNRVPPAVQEATRRLSPRPGRRRVRNGFPSLLGDRAARRRDVRARWRHGPREAPGSGRKREARVGVRAKGSSDAECARGRTAGRGGRSGRLGSGRRPGVRGAGPALLPGLGASVRRPFALVLGPRGGRGSPCSLGGKGSDACRGQGCAGASLVSECSGGELIEKTLVTFSS